MNRTSKRILSLALLLSCNLTFAAPLFAADLPKVKVVSLRKVFHNGQHNSFTDLCRFAGRIYLTFRSCPDGHMVHPTSSIIVLSSDDEGTTWQQVHRFSVDKRDTRDPHFLVFKEKLFLYSGTWYCGDSSPESRDMNQHLGFAVSTVDGKNWEGPTMLEGTYGHYIWRAATHDGKAYLCARRKRLFAEHTTRGELDELVESALLESDDGLVWHQIGMFQHQYGDETGFLFEKDGSLLAVSRTRGNRNAQVVRMTPPYKSAKRTELDRYIGGPLLARWNDHYLVGGRKINMGKAVCSLYWLADDALHEFAELPSGGDCSYPGFVQLSDSRALVSYYSSHEKDAQGNSITAIYLAELEIQ